MSTSVELDGVRMISLQFSFSNPDVLPWWLRESPDAIRETHHQQKDRLARATGQLVIPPTERCSTKETIEELGQAGWYLVDAVYQERLDQKDPEGKRTFHMVRFLFSQFPQDDLPDKFKTIQGLLVEQLREICDKALWRVRVFLNPFYKNGEEITGQHALSVNLEARVPLFHPDGQPVKEWQKDGQGRRIGDGPQPLQPSHQLRLQGNALVLL